MTEMPEMVWYLHIHRKGKVMDKVFYHRDEAKQAAELTWREWQSWHQDRTPLQWKDDEHYSVPTNEAYMVLSGSGELSIVLSKCRVMSGPESAADMKRRGWV